MKINILAIALTASLMGASPSYAIHKTGYVDLELQSDGSALSVSQSGELAGLESVTGDPNSKIFINHLGEFALFAGEDDSENNKVQIATLASSSSVEIAWRSVSPIRGELYRDGQFLTKIENQNSYFDEGLDTGSIHQYQLALNPITSDVPIDENDSTNVIMAGTTVQLPSQNSLTAVSALAAAPQASYSILRYLTFIKDKYIGTPLIGCLPFGTHFLGNNRSFNPYATAQDSKTILTLRVDWNTLSAEYWAYVGPTIMYTLNTTTGVYTETFHSQASNDGLWVSLIRPILATSGEFEMYIDAANPDCLGLPIKVDINVLIKRTGNYYIAGAIRFVPNHEFYLYQENTGTWTTIYRKSISPIGFDCFNKFSTVSYSSQCIDNVTMSTGGVVTFG